MNSNPESAEILDQNFRELCSLLADVHDEQFIYDFFGCLFTPAERKDFADRWLLVKELNAGTVQREIARKFNISLCKITRGSREFQKKDSAFRKMLELLAAREKK